MVHQVMMRVRFPHLLPQEPSLLGCEPGGLAGRANPDLESIWRRRGRGVHPREGSPIQVAADLGRCPVGRGVAFGPLHMPLSSFGLIRVDGWAGERPGHVLRRQLLGASQAWLRCCNRTARSERGSGKRTRTRIQGAAVEQAPCGVGAHQRRRCHGSQN